MTNRSEQNWPEGTAHEIHIDGRIAMEARIDGEAAARIAQWEPCKGQVEYVQVLATRAAHLANIALANQAEADKWNAAGAHRTADDIAVSREMAKRIFEKWNVVR